MKQKGKFEKKKPRKMHINNDFENTKDCLLETNAEFNLLYLLQVIID